MWNTLKTRVERKSDCFSDETLQGSADRMSKRVSASVRKTVKF